MANTGDGGNATYAALRGLAAPLLVAKVVPNVEPVGPRSLDGCEGWRTRCRGVSDIVTCPFANVFRQCLRSLSHTTGGALLLKEGRQLCLAIPATPICACNSLSSPVS